MTRLRFLFLILLGIATLSLLSSTTGSTPPPSQAEPAVESPDTRHPTPDSPNVILITIDTLRADYVSAYGSRKVQTPTLDALANEGVLFTDAYCQVPLTPPSHASILTGTYPATHGLRDFTSARLPAGSTTLASILRGRGYHTAAFVSAYVLDSSWGFNQGFDLYYDNFDLQEFRGVNPGNVQRRAGETIAHVLDWLKGAKQPFFLWVHLFDPHHDYDPPQPFRSRYASNLYAGEVAYADSELGKFIAALRRSGYYENSLIIAASDHGESLGEHKEHEHGFFLYEPTVRIPLIIKLPRGATVRARSVSDGSRQVYNASQNQVWIAGLLWRDPSLTLRALTFSPPLAPAARIWATLPYARGSAPVTRGNKIDLIAQTVDIVPTVLQVLRIPVNPAWKIEGKGLLSAILAKPTPAGFAYSETLYPRTTFGWKELRVYRERQYKFIDAPRAELYDVSKDPSEAHNLYASSQSLAHQLQQKLQHLERGFHSPSLKGRPAGSNDADSDKVERLGALGYVALSQPVPVRTTGRLEDPKDSIDIYNRILEGLQAAEGGKLQASNNILREVASSHPELFIVHYSLGMNCLKMGQPEQALEAFDKARKLNPGFDLTDINSARALAALGRVDEAISILKKVAARGPSHLSTQRQLGLLLSRARRYDEAVQLYRDMLKQRPGDKQTIKFLGIALVEDQKYTEGLAQLNRVVELGAADALTYNFLGIALANTGHVPEAVSSYQKALELKPDYDQARLNLSLTLLKSGNATEAQKEFQLLCAANPRLCKQYESYFR